VPEVVGSTKFASPTTKSASPLLSRSPAARSDWVVGVSTGMARSQVKPPSPSPSTTSTLGMPVAARRSGPSGAPSSANVPPEIGERVRNFCGSENISGASIAGHTSSSPPSGTV
jgi:hypothetical protein